MPRGPRFTSPLPFESNLDTPRVKLGVVGEPTEGYGGPAAADSDLGLRDLDQGQYQQQDQKLLARELARLGFDAPGAAVERFGAAVVRAVLTRLAGRDLSHVANLGGYVNRVLHQAAREPAIAGYEDRLEPYRRMAQRYARESLTGYTESA